VGAGKAKAPVVSNPVASNHNHGQPNGQMDVGGCGVVLPPTNPQTGQALAEGEMSRSLR
jgi:hypothetical protein